MMTYENIKLEKHNKWGKGEVICEIDDFIKPLVEKLALKYPHWTFVQKGAHTDHIKETLHVTGFKVFDKREEIGFIGIDYTRKGKQFFVDNHRIDGMRERGRGMKTIHMDKAVRHIVKYFGKKNLDEKLEEAKEKAGRMLHSLRSDAQYTISRYWERTLRDDAMMYIVSNFDAFMQTVTSDVELKSKFPTALKEFREIYSMADSEDFFLVYIDGTDYSVIHKSEAPQIKKSEELPDAIRRGIGLLKLSEIGTLVSGVGVRVEENTFMVLPNNVS